MRRFLSRVRLAAGAVVLLAAGTADAGWCGRGMCGGCGGVGLGDSGYWGAEYNIAWLYPDGGFTLYPGQAGSCYPSHSDYSKVNWTVPPTATAQAVLDKLRELGVPQVPPDTIYLGKNPSAVEKARLPIPGGWTPKEVEPKEADPKDKELKKLDVKPKEDPKAKDSDTDR